MSKEESKPDPFENAVDGGTPEGSLLAIRQAYEIELKFRDGIIADLESQLSKAKELLRTATTWIICRREGKVICDEIESFLKS